VYLAPVRPHARSTATPSREQLVSRAERDNLGHVLQRAVAQRARGDVHRAGPHNGPTGGMLLRDTQRAPASTISITSARQQSIQRWATLGQEAWWNPLNEEWRQMFVYTAVASEWRTALEDMDDMDEYRDNLWGFIRASIDPGLIGKKTGPGEEYYNDIKRRPNDQEKIEFLHALFTTGGSLDLWEGGSFEEGDTYIGPDFAKFIRLNQDLYLRAMAADNRYVDADMLGAIATEGGYDTTIAMIVSAGASAFKGLHLLVIAESEADKTVANSLIQNAGITLRGVLAAHTERVAFKTSVINSVFDQLWGKLPGAGPVITLTKDIFKPILSSGLVSLAATSRDTTPKKKFAKIYEAFQTGAAELSNPTKKDRYGNKLPAVLSSVETASTKALFNSEVK